MLFSHWYIHYWIKDGTNLEVNGLSDVWLYDLYNSNMFQALRCTLCKQAPGCIHVATYLVYVIFNPLLGTCALQIWQWLNIPGYSQLLDWYIAWLTHAHCQPLYCCREMNTSSLYMYLYTIPWSGHKKLVSKYWQVQLQYINGSLNGTSLYSVWRY